METAAFSVDGLLEDAGLLVRLSIRLRILLLLDSHHVERVEAGQHGATDPRCVLSVQGISDDDIGLGIMGNLPQLELEPCWEVSELGGASREHNVVVQLDLQV